MDYPKGHVIRNFSALARSPARAAILSIVEAGYEAIQTQKVVRDTVHVEGGTLTVGNKRYVLDEYRHIYIIGVGKCSIDAAHALEASLGDHITEGAVLDVREASGLPHIKVYTGTHPYPSEQNATYTAHLLSLAKKADEHDLVLTIISGGGSTLLCQPKTHTCADEARLVKHLFKKGATITELNIVRKHLSMARGGHLAQAAYPARVISLIFSDVPGDDMGTIASGPTVRDESTLADARAVLDKYGGDAFDFSANHLFETPKEDVYFAEVHNVLALTNRTALEAMRARAEELSYHAIIRDTHIQGEARDVARTIVEELHTQDPRTVLLYGGETTVTITGPGKGGRNEELSLAALPLIHDDELIVSVASDGRDNTEYAGGIADTHTREQATLRGVSAEHYLYTNDSFSFFHTLQQGIDTGYTGSNVADLIVAMKHGEMQ